MTAPKPARKGPRPAEHRLRRLLVILPWLMEHAPGYVPLAEAAARFDLAPEVLAADLDQVALCGLPPYVDEMIDLFVDDDQIYVGVPRIFTRPLQLNAVEAFELLVAGNAALQLPGGDPDGPLARGLRKLASALGQDDTGIVVVNPQPPYTTELAAAAEAGERVRIEYWSASSDEVSSRSIVPRQVFVDRGDWYVRADDDRSGELRTFRIDRIRALQPTGETVPTGDAELSPPGEWFADGAVPRVTLRVAPTAGWVAERYPVDEVTEPDSDGWITLRLPVASERWLARVLVRLGPDAAIVDGAEFAGVGAAAAARILARYA